MSLIFSIVVTSGLIYGLSEPIVFPCLNNLSIPWPTLSLNAMGKGGR